jgi:hypothetical protein
VVENQIELAEQNSEMNEALQEMKQHISAMSFAT